MLKRTYESMVLLDNREVKKGWQNLKDEVCGLFSKHGAEIKSARRWDERRLAYPVKHQLRGTYMLMYFDSDTSQLAAIGRDLEYYEPVLRYMTFACDEVPADAFEPESEFDEAAVRVEDTDSMREAIAAEAEAIAESGGRGGRGDRSSRGSRSDQSEKAEAAPKADAAAKTDEGEKPAEAKAEAPAPDADAKGGGESSDKEDDK